MNIICPLPVGIGLTALAQNLERSTTRVSTNDYIRFVNESKVKKERKDDSENEVIDQLEIPVNNEIQDNSNLPDIGQAHNMFSRFLNLRITKFSLFCFSTR